MSRTALFWKTFELARHGAGLGVDTLAVAPPYYYPHNDYEVFAHYKAIRSMAEWSLGRSCASGDFLSAAFRAESVRILERWRTGKMGFDVDVRLDPPDEQEKS